MTVELRNGDVVTGEIVERTDDHIVLDHPVLGRLEIPMEQIEPRSLHVGIAGTRFLEGWDKEISFGLTGSEGNTDEMDVVAKLELDYGDEKRRWQIRGTYELGFTDDDRDDHAAQATVMHDWLFTDSRWFAFSYSLYDYDEFEPWEHRVTTGGGPGYDILEGPPFELDARTGPFFTYEFGEEDNARPEYALGFFANWKLGDRNSIRIQNVYFQTLDHAEFRNLSGFEWKLGLAPTRALSVKLGVRNEYDSAAREKKDDFKYYSTLSFDL